MAKTAAQIFKMASALIYENVTDDAESKAFTLDFLNIHLQECLDVENSIRRADGETELTEAPFLTAADLSESIDYHDALTRVALPYACAAHYYAEAMNPAKADEFNAKYEGAKSKAAKLIEEDITDAYAAEE